VPTIALAELEQLDSSDLATWVKPRPVDPGRGDLMVQAAVAAVTEAIFPRTTVPSTAKAVVLEAAARGYAPRVQQESLGSRSVSYFAPGDPRSGVFLTEEDLRQLGVFDHGLGVIWTRSPGGAVR
jgi:hypothetical protein